MPRWSAAVSHFPFKQNNKRESPMIYRMAWQGSGGDHPPINTVGLPNAHHLQQWYSLLHKAFLLCIEFYLDHIKLFEAGPLPNQVL